MGSFWTETNYFNLQESNSEPKLKSKKCKRKPKIAILSKSLDTLRPQAGNFIRFCAVSSPKFGIF